MTGLDIGAKAPDFSLETDDGARFVLSKQFGHLVVLFFYPADNTEGCTRENIEFTENLAQFEAMDTRVVGISPDTAEDHRKFRQKHKLGIVLAADPQHEAISAFQVWGPKVLFGKKYDGLIRTTFLIDAKGNIAKIWRVTRIKDHAADVLRAVQAVSRKPVDQAGT